jgi:HEAT repeat protein
MTKTVAEREAFLEGAVLERSADGLVSLLAEAMRDPSPSVRSSAIRIVADHEVGAAIPHVEKLLSDRSERVRIAAVEGLGAFRGGLSPAKLYPSLKDSSFLVRIGALESLALLKDLKAPPRIAPLLSDKNPLVRAYAARSIAALQGGSYTQVIHETLEKEREDSAKVGLLEALFLLGRGEALSSFLELLSSDDYRVRCSVANSLENMPLNGIQIETAMAALSRAESEALGVADKSSIATAMDKLKRVR